MDNRLPLNQFIYYGIHIHLLNKASSVSEKADVIVNSAHEKKWLE